MEKVRTLYTRFLLLIISTGPEDYRYEEVDVPEPGYQEILVKVKSSVGL